MALRQAALERDPHGRRSPGSLHPRTDPEFVSAGRAPQCHAALPARRDSPLHRETGTVRMINDSCLDTVSLMLSM